MGDNVSQKDKRPAGRQIHDSQARYMGLAAFNGHAQEAWINLHTYKTEPFAPHWPPQTEAQRLPPKLRLNTDVYPRFLGYVNVNGQVREAWNNPIGMGIQPLAIIWSRTGDPPRFTPYKGEIPPRPPAPDPVVDIFKDVKSVSVKTLSPPPRASIRRRQGRLSRYAAAIGLGMLPLMAWLVGRLARGHK